MINKTEKLNSIQNNLFVPAGGQLKPDDDKKENVPLNITVPFIYLFL